MIGVPAIFDEAAVQATKQAANLADIGYVVPVQEPVLAAMAFGFQNKSEKETWLVYDLGGGTFDVALVQLKAGRIEVVAHGGDAKLGGKDIDWAIVEDILAPKIAQRHNLRDFNRNQKRWKTAFAKLKGYTEEAKTELSNTDSAYLDIEPLVNEPGLEFGFEYTLTRDEVEQAAGPIIMKTVRICRQLLKENGVAPNKIDRMLLVGGSTKMPILRRMLEEELGIPLDVSVDPLTAIAQGAAIVAQTIDVHLLSVPKGEWVVELLYDRVGKNLQPEVAGKVISPDGGILEGYTVEFVHTKTKWTSGQIALNRKGSFMVNLKAEAGERNEYEIVLRDRTGSLLLTSPSKIQYTVGNAPGQMTQLRPLKIGLFDGETLEIVKKGEILPFDRTQNVTTVKVVRHGVRDSLLEFPRSSPKCAVKCPLPSDWPH